MVLLSTKAIPQVISSVYSQQIVPRSFVPLASCVPEECPPLSFHFIWISSKFFQWCLSNLYSSINSIAVLGDPMIYFLFAYLSLVFIIAMKIYFVLSKLFFKACYLTSCISVLFNHNFLNREISAVLSSWSFSISFVS